MNSHKWPTFHHLPLPTAEDALVASRGFLPTKAYGPWHVFASKRYRLASGLIFLTGLYCLVQLFRAPFVAQSTTATTTIIRPSPPWHETTDVDWSRFAYTQYATNSEYLCNSVMIFEALHRLGSRPDRVLMHPAGMLRQEEGVSGDAQLLIKARDEYKVKLVPIAVQHRNGADMTWADSFTKLLAFNQTQYDRVLSLDSDSTLLGDMDELFLLPPTPVAMPRAYWLFPEKPVLSSQVVLIQPSAAEFARVMDRVATAGPADYDMEIVNDLYGASAMVLPHRPYDMLTAEFRRKDHAAYLGGGGREAAWDPVEAYSEARLVHFSDWPLPKPWLETPEDVRVQMQPECRNTTEGVEDCSERVIWNNLYADFKKRRKGVCDIKLSSGNGNMRPKRYV